MEGRVATLNKRPDRSGSGADAWSPTSSPRSAASTSCSGRSTGERDAAVGGRPGSVAGRRARPDRRSAHPPIPTRARRSCRSCGSRSGSGLALARPCCAWSPTPSAARDRVFGVATFYTMFNLKPIGRHHLQVCMTLSCSLMGADRLFRSPQTKLGIGHGRPRPTAASRCAGSNAWRPAAAAVPAGQRELSREPRPGWVTAC